MKKHYFVKLECHKINGIKVSANSKEEAIKIAKNNLKCMCKGEFMNLYEIEEIIKNN